MRLFRKKKQDVAASADDIAYSPPPQFRKGDRVSIPSKKRLGLVTAVKAAGKEIHVTYDHETFPYKHSTSELVSTDAPIPPTPVPKPPKPSRS